MKRTLRVGTRGSALAIAQTKHIIALLGKLNPSLDIETIIIRTTGDTQSQQQSNTILTKGVFVKEIEEALLSKNVDFAVHSLKDLPSELHPELEIAAIPRRETPCDAVVSHSLALNDLPFGSIIGAGGPRRMVLIRNIRPDLRTEPIRGNVDTRLRKWREGKYDAIILAAAGLKRLGLEDNIVEELDPAKFIPAPGQGALALEIRKENRDIRSILEPLDHPPSHVTVSAERCFQSALGSGCSIPAGAYASIAGEILSMHAFLAIPNGVKIVRTHSSDHVSKARELGIRIARELMDGIEGKN